MFDAIARPKSCCAAVLAAAALAIAAPARAQDWTPRTQGNRLGADADYVPDPDDRLFDATFVGQLRLTPLVYADFELPSGYLFDDRHGNQHAFVIGNPTLGLHLSSTVNRHLALHLGALVSIPTHTAGFEGPGSEGTNAATTIAYARGLDDVYRFFPQYVEIVPRLGLEVAFRPLFVRIDLRPVVAVPVDHDDSVWLLVLHTIELEILADVGLGGGVRLQSVAYPLPSGPGDDFAFAVEPYVAFEPEPRGVFARLGVLVQPWGIEGRALATIHGAVGAKW